VNQQDGTPPDARLAAFGIMNTSGAVATGEGHDRFFLPFSACRPAAARLPLA
jgi:hypothetical protein